MAHVRWYDKNPKLKELMEFIENLDQQRQAQIARDILCSLMCDYGLDLDDKINEIYEQYNYKCNRWYDQNPDLFTSVAIIREFPQDLQDEVVDNTIKTIVEIYIEEGINV